MEHLNTCYLFISNLLRTFEKGEKGELEKINGLPSDFLMYCFSHACVLMALKAIALSGNP